MEKSKKDEELQSRREFFKNAAKGALPILTLSALGSTILSSCSPDKSDSCKYGCSGSCSGSCAGSCDKNCSGDCHVSSGR